MLETSNDSEVTINKIQKVYQDEYNKKLLLVPKSVEKLIENAKNKSEEFAVKYMVD